MVAPARHARGDHQKVNADLRTALDDPDVNAKLAANGAFVRHISPQEVIAFVQDQQKTWRPILEQVNREIEIGRELSAAMAGLGPVIPLGRALNLINRDHRVSAP